MLRVDRRLIAHFEWPLFLCVLLLIAVGLMTILSATRTEDAFVSGYVIRQLSWAGVGTLGMLAALSFDYHLLQRYGYVLYAGAVALLVLTAVTGVVGGGAQRWLKLGPVAIQPSEFVKMPVVIACAAFLHRYVSEEPVPTRILLVPALLLGVPVLLILEQPDLGTAIIVAVTGGSVVLVAGMRPRLLLTLAAAVALAIPWAWSFLKPYQQQRVLTFLDPQSDPLGSGYHIIQSKIAIGAGQLTGKGWLQGSQNRLEFLPEQHTDFVFSVFAEEWGFVGCVLLLLAFVALLTRCFIIALRAKDSFGLLLATGVSTNLICQVLINIGMTTGTLPVVGATLPFVSYGGSSLLVSMVGVGLLMNVSMRRFTF
jgi:rod shape determining protein RodA